MAQMALHEHHSGVGRMQKKPAAFDFSLCCYRPSDYILRSAAGRQHGWMISGWRREHDSSLQMPFDNEERSARDERVVVWHSSRRPTSGPSQLEIRGVLVASSGWGLPRYTAVRYIPNTSVPRSHLHNRSSSSPKRGAESHNLNLTSTYKIHPPGAPALHTPDTGAASYSHQK